MSDAPISSVEGKTLKKVGKIDVGSTVMAPREADDDEFEPCTVSSIVTSKGLLNLAFADGYVRNRVDVATVRLPSEIASEIETAVDHKATAEKAASALKLAPGGQDETAYVDEVVPTLPAPPTADALAVDGEAKYTYIKAYKDAGNALFKAGKYAWAIRTYTSGVDELAKHCYESRERMLWDYFARGPCGQCFSNAALCALKLPDPAQAEMLCEMALECRPEDTDLVKVLLRKGQALLALSRPEEAKEVLERAADKEPSNRAVREELVKAKRAVKDLLKDGEKRLFQGVSLAEKGLTSKKDEQVERLRDGLEKGFEVLVEHKDEEAITLLTPLLEDKNADLPHRQPSTLLAAYGVGIAKYHQKKLGASIKALGFFFRMKEQFDAGGVEYNPPLMGVPLARFYYAHALFETQKLDEAREQLTAFLQDVVEAGPQKILNMPSGMLGKQITDAERSASRFKHRACSPGAQADAHTMLAIIAERVDGPSAAIEHFEAAIRLTTSLDQKAEGHENLAKTYAALKDDEKAAEHQAKSIEFKEQAAKEAEEARRKKADEAAKEAEADEKAEPEVRPLKEIPDATGSEQAMDATPTIPDVTDVVQGL